MRGGGGSAGPGRRRRTGSRGVITGLCAANHSGNTARAIRDLVRLTEIYQSILVFVMFKIPEKSEENSFSGQVAVVA